MKRLVLCILVVMFALVHIFSLFAMNSEPTMKRSGVRIVLDEKDANLIDHFGAEQLPMLHKKLSITCPLCECEALPLQGFLLESCAREQCREELDAKISTLKDWIETSKQFRESHCRLGLLLRKTPVIAKALGTTLLGSLSGGSALLTGTWIYNESFIPIAEYPRAF